MPLNIELIKKKKRKNNKRGVERRGFLVKQLKSSLSAFRQHLRQAVLLLPRKESLSLSRCPTKYSSATFCSTKMTANDVSSGVSNCYVFKSMLQEYAQKYKLPTPVYETVKEGPSHKSFFQSTVTLDGVRYHSLPGFFNRKAAEQSAAEVALQELAKSSDLSQCVSQPVHETGLCKNLLQEYAQKMNYAIPLYQCQNIETLGRTPHFICTVEIGGIKYTGAATKTKKDAEISAGRTALLAIQSVSINNLANYNSQLTVLPCEKKTVETASPLKDTIKTPKARKARFKRKGQKVRRKVANDSEDVITLTQPTEHCQNDQSANVETTVNLEPSSCMSGFKEAAFGSVETEASQA